MFCISSLYLWNPHAGIRVKIAPSFVYYDPIALPQMEKFPPCSTTPYNVQTQPSQAAHKVYMPPQNRLWWKYIHKHKLISALTTPQNPNNQASAIDALLAVAKVTPQQPEKFTSNAHVSRLGKCILNVRLTGMVKSKNAKKQEQEEEKN